MKFRRVSLRSIALEIKYLN